MRRKYTYVLMMLIAILLLPSCAAKSEEVPVVPTVTAYLTESVVSTDAPLTAATEAPTTAVETEIPTTAAEPERSLPYLQRIERSDQSIYDGPGYDHCFVGTVQQRGTYTIVEEVWDFEGNLWGKLKSGAGWVDLTEIRSQDNQNALISANYADENLLLHGAYHHFSSCQEYSVPIAIRAYCKLRDVTIYPIEFSDEGILPGADLIALPELTEEMPLVAELSFPGDMSTYGIQFVDEDGSTHVYSIYISGRNGALILVEES